MTVSARPAFSPRVGLLLRGWASPSACVRRAVGSGCPSRGCPGRAVAPRDRSELREGRRGPEIGVRMAMTPRLR